MSEAKYKVGDEVETVGGCVGLPGIITEVRTVYKVRFNNGSEGCPLWNEHELRPYVRPLAVGDRVRACASGCQGVIIATHKNEFWVDRGERYGCVTYHADELERIPTEEAGK